MPYEWSGNDGAQMLRAWPYQSLPRTGFVWFIGVTSAMFLVPLTALVGTSILWGILPFMLLVIGGVWFALERSYRTGRTVEELRLSHSNLHLTRHDPGKKADREWDANPYWVRVRLRRGPVEDYLTLTDGGREVELGAFLTPEERRALHDDLIRRLAKNR